MKIATVGFITLVTLGMGMLVISQKAALGENQVAGQPITPATSASTPTPPSVNPEPEKLSTLGTQPLTRDIHWTAYYIAPVKKTTPEKGETVIFIDRQGEKHRVALTETSRNEANEEAVAVGIDKNGKKRFAYKVGDNIWRELPAGAEGMGNKVNVLIPMVHVAAQQGIYPYGSMVFLPKAVGYKLADHPPLDGYFWIADCGSAVRGNHFDAFVGDEHYYQAFVGNNIKPELKTIIYPLPKLPKAKDPKNDAGLARILQKIGLLKTDKPTPDELKQAVIAYQKTVSHIPEAEYGDPDAATTLWFLTQEVLIQDKKDAEETKAHTGDDPSKPQPDVTK